MGDLHICLMLDGPKPHVGGPVLEGNIRVLIGGQPTATLGSKCICVSPALDVIIQGSLMVLIGGRPAARMGDMTMHGGTITSGFLLVLIGDVVSFIDAKTNVLASKADTIVTAKSGYDVQIKSTGFPDFTSEALLSVEIPNMIGGANDYAAANEIAFPVIFSNHNMSYEQQKWVYKWADDGKYAHCVWHHHEDGKTMQLVPKQLNIPNEGGINHSGGTAVTKHNNNFSQYPLSLPSPNV